MHRGDSVADPLCTQELHRVMDLLRSADLSGMNQTVKALRGDKVVRRAELGGGQGQLVAAHAEGDDTLLLVIPSEQGNFSGCFRAELAHGIEDPTKSEAFSGTRLAGPADGLKVCFGDLLAEEHDADGNRQFGIDDILFEEAGRQLLRGQCIVLRIAQEGCDPLESLEELRKAVVGIVAASPSCGNNLTVTRSEAANQGGLDGAFQVQVQLRLRQREKLRGKRRNSHSQEISAAAAGDGRRSPTPYTSTSRHRWPRRRLAG